MASGTSLQNPRRPRVRSLHQKLIVLLLLVGLVPLLIVATVNNLQAARALEQQANTQLSELAAASIDRLDRNLFDRYGNVQAFASSDGARAMDALRITPLMARMTTIYAPFYRLMLVADANGQIIAASSARADGTYLDGARFVGDDVQTEAWFSVWRNRQIAKSSAYVEDVHADVRVAQLYGDDGYVIAFSQGIFNQAGTLIGVWVDLVDWQQIEHILTEIEMRPHAQGAQSVRLSIVNNADMVLAGAAKPLITHYTPPADSLVQRATSTGYSGFAGLGWSVIATQDRAEALQTARSLTTRTIVAAALLGMLVVIIGVSATRLLTRPVRVLQHAAEQVAAGDLNVRVPARDDEIGQLGQSFNLMTHQLQELYTGLESKVAQRTSELQTTLVNLLHSKGQLEASQQQLSATNATLAASETRYRELLERTQEALAETEALYRTARTLIGSERLSDVLQAVVDGAVMALQANAVSLITFDVDRQQVTNVVTGGPGVQQIRNVTFDELWAGLSGWVLRDGQPVLSVKDALDPRESQQARQQRMALGNGAAIVVPLMYRDQVLGTMTAINRLDQRDFAERDVALLLALANQASIAIENARLFESAQRRAHEAETLARVSGVVAATLRREEAISRILEQLALVIPYDSASVQLLHDSYLEIVGGRDRHTDLPMLGQRFPIPGDNPNTLVIQRGRPFIINDAVRDFPAFYDRFGTGRHIASWLGVPLIVHERVIGMLTIDKIEPHYFTPDLARVALAFADQVAVAIENANLYTAAQQELAERRRAEAELRRYQEHLEEQVAERTAELADKNKRLQESINLARDIQIGLLPDRPPWNIESVAVFGRSMPATDVGGDFYTFIATPMPHIIGLAIGDISGKGVGAALMMALVSSAVETEVRTTSDFQPAAILDALNTQLTPRLQANRMNAALLVMRIDLQQRILCVANAGMITPLLVRDGTATYIDAYGLPLGAMSGLQYAETSATLADNDLLLLISDGIVEAHDDQHRLFGFERLEALISTYTVAMHLPDLVSDVIEHVMAFTRNSHQHDDMTIVALRPHGVSTAAQPSLAPSEYASESSFAPSLDE